MAARAAIPAKVAAEVVGMAQEDLTCSETAAAAAGGHLRAERAAGAETVDATGFTEKMGLPAASATFSFWATKLFSVCPSGYSCS